VPAIPAAAKRDSMSEAEDWPGPTMGVSGGGGEPRWARVVDVDAVELMRFIPLPLPPPPPDWGGWRDEGGRGVELCGGG
jgi:hypothetical protein